MEAYTNQGDPQEHSPPKPVSYFEWVQAFRTTRTGLSPSVRCVLLILASHADNDTGRSHPGLAVLAEECEVSQRYISTALGKGVEAGWLERSCRGGGRNGKATVYHLTVPKNVGTGGSHNEDSRKGHGTFSYDSWNGDGTFHPGENVGTNGRNVGTTAQECRNLATPGPGIYRINSLSNSFSKNSLGCAASAATSNRDEGNASTHGREASPRSRQSVENDAEKRAVAIEEIASTLALCFSDLNESAMVEFIKQTWWGRHGRRDPDAEKQVHDLYRQLVKAKETVTTCA